MPVAVWCTWASTNAGATSAPSRSTTASAESRCSSAPAAGPIQAIVASTTSIAPAPGTDGA